MKKLYSLIATLLAFSIILSMFTMSFVTASAVTTDVWNGKTATEFAGGEGTQANPYRIENGAQLAKAVIDKGLKNGAPAYYIITNDIYLNEDYLNYKNWATTAPANNWGATYSSEAFAGYLDGAYHTIYGMYYSRGGSYAGLVAYLSGTGATICNLTIANSYVKNTSANSTALFAGRIDNGTIKNSIARDSYITNKDNKTMAGIAAWSNTNTTKITNCGAYNLTFSSGATTVGGILAQSNGGNATVSSCFSGGTFIFGNTGNIACSSSCTDIDSAWKNGVTEILDGTMKGTGAVEKMALSKTVWKDTETYPTLIGNGTKGEVWSGAQAAWFAGGKGTATHPFLIETGEQLCKAVKDLGKKSDGTSAYYLITADIYLNNNYENYADWATTPAANNWGVTYSGSSFTGNINGGYHTIYGMYNNTSGSYAGLVAYLSGTGAKICNLAIANSYVTNSNADTSALFAGRLDNGTIENCIARDSYITNKNNKTMAGIAAWSNTSTTKIINCGAYNLTFSSGAATVGGILAQSNGGNATVSSCFSGGTFIFGNTGNIACSSSCTDIDSAWKNGVTEILDGTMKGTGAVEKMALSKTVWKDTQSYPTFALNNGTKGEVWTGASAASFIGGDGTEADPYLIETAEQLCKAVKELGKKSDGTSAYYLITADIYLNNNYENYADWATTPATNNWSVTYSASSFTGNINGGYHTIYGMYNNTSGSYAGLVAYLSGTGAKICNLTIANSYVTNSNANTSAIFAGRLDNGTIENCIARDSYITNKDNKTMAGIAAWSNTNTTKITNCGAYNLTFSSGATTVGGILAQSNNGNATVINCYSAGTYIFGNTNNISCAHSYTDIAHDWKNGVSNKSATPEVMIGTAAVEGMKYLDFINTWQTVENGYPIIRAAKNNNLNQEISTSYAIKHSNNGWSIFTTKIDMPKINPTYDDNIAITIDGVKKIVSEAGILISREGFEKADISEVNNTPLTGYKVVGYTNGADNSALVKVGGQIEITAIINGTVDYTARSYIVFNDETVVIGDIIDTELTTDEITVDNGTEIRDVFESGDANFDGVINLKDLVRFKQYAADVQVNKNALFDVIDMDKNNAFGATDISKLRIELLSNIDVSHDSNMELVFEDNFDSYLLDANKWDFNDYMTGYGVVTDVTSDVQSIQREADGNGYLHLTAYKTDDGTYKSVKSISTGDKLTFVHGYLEIRAKVPTVKGAWPSLWLKSNTKNTNLGWKNDFLYNTEVDVFEVMGGNRAISELHKWQYVAETGVTNDYRYSQKFDRNSYAIPDNDWHTYGMLWNDDEIVMYVDDVAIQRYDLNKDFQVKWFWDKGLGMDGFKNQPLCITLNNHLFTPSYVATEAGNWAKDYALDDNFTESVYDIDYVRLYQDKSDANAKLYKAN